VLKKINRSLKKSDFEWLREEGVMYRTPLFGVLVGENTEEKNQFGIIVSRKISKKAVERNKIRRLVYEAIRLKQAVLVSKGLKIVVLANKSLLEKKYEEVEKEVEQVFKKINEKNNIVVDKKL
jgi:ribonuclease P protein component